VVLPERIDDAFIDWLAALPLQKVVVLHANHANEFDAAVDAACARLRDAGATLLNQSVLLKDVNDDAEALVALCERSFAAGVLPYYLHQLDKVGRTGAGSCRDAAQPPSWLPRPKTRQGIAGRSV
jgi:L-lysine 2,3-aminomutase